MINTVILDIGRVTGKFDWQEYISTLGYPEDINNQIAKATVLTPMWNELDKGVMDDEELLRGFIQNNPAIEPYLREFFEHIPEIVVEYEYSEQFVLDLKKNGYKVYVLSNFGKKPFEEFSKRCRFLKHVDGAVISYQEKCTKPSAEIYEILLKRYNIVPQEAVFLDDMLPNLEAAANFGISGILFENINQAKEVLNNIGVHI